MNATGGDTRLGGEDFDANVVKFLSQTFKKTHKDAVLSERAIRRLYAAAERAKRQLSSATQAEVEVESLADGNDLKMTLTRAKFESLNQSHFDSCLATVKAVLKDSGLAKDQIDDVVLVGGSTRVPKVTKGAVGGASLTALLPRSHAVPTSFTSLPRFHTFHTRSTRSTRSTRPAILSQVREMLSSFFNGKELCSSINPDEAVAYGAAVQAGVLSGGLAAAGGALAKASEQLVLMDVVPLSLGIETTGRVMSTIVKRNTAIPCRKSDTFTTEEDWQTEIDVVVYEGARPHPQPLPSWVMASPLRHTPSPPSHPPPKLSPSCPTFTPAGERASVDACNELGKFTINGLERAKRGEPQVVVTFDIDANGILSVTAVDKVTNAKGSVTITSTTARNSKADVARMVADAERFAADDAKLKQKTEARRMLEDLVRASLIHI